MIERERRRVTLAAVEGRPLATVGQEAAGVRLLAVTPGGRHG